MNNTVEQKPNKMVRLAAFLLTLALMLGAVAAVAHRDRINFDALKRWYTYRTLSKGDSGQAEQFSYEGGTDSRFADLDGDLLVCASSAVRIYSAGGVLYLEDAASLEQPAVVRGGGMAAVYDVGGNVLRVFDRRNKVFSLDAGGNTPVLSVTLSESGYLAVTTKDSGYKGVVNVYDSSFNAVMSLRLSSRFLMDAVVTGDGRSLAAVAVGQVDGAFESSVLFYHLDDGDEPYAVCSLGDNVILSVDADSTGLWAMGDSGLSVLSRDGALTGQFDYGGRYLKNASLDGDGFAALMLGKYRAGSTAELFTIDADGEVMGTLSVPEQVFSLSASGKYVAVLTADRLDIYTKDLTLYHTLEGTRGARSVVMRSDGSAFLIGSEAAGLYLPQ